MMRVVIADDEPLARLRVRQLLAEQSDMQIVGEADQGGRAVEMIETLKPDLVFLDIQMPNMNGFDVIEAVGVRRMPATVFVTAYDTFAIRAFEVQALDYLLKPFDDLRFAQVLARARTAGARKDLLQRMLAHVAPGQRLVARARGTVRLIPFQQIDWIAAAGDYAEVHADGQSWLVNETLTSLSGRLPPGLFARIHRATIVRLDRIEEIRPGSHGDGMVHLINGAALRFSRRYRQPLEAWLTHKAP